MYVYNFNNIPLADALEADVFKKTQKEQLRILSNFFYCHNVFNSSIQYLKLHLQILSMRLPRNIQSRLLHACHVKEKANVGLYYKSRFTKTNLIAFLNMCDMLTCSSVLFNSNVIEC